MKIINIEQNSKEWHEFRKTHLGASESPIIMQLSPWATPLQLWSRKLGIEPEQEQNSAMQRGKELEPLALALFNAERGYYCKAAVVVSDEYDYMSASLDGYDPEKNIIVEIKCPGKDDHETAKSGRVPEKYYPQLQKQMLVAELDIIYYYSFKDDEGITVIVHRNEEFIKELIEKEKEFYKCLITFSPPPMCDRDYSQGSKEWIQTAKDLKTIKETMKSMEEQEERLTEILISLSDNRNTNGDGTKFTRSYRKGNIQYHNIPELSGIDLEKYRKQGSHFWRLSSTKDE